MAEGATQSGGRGASPADVSAGDGDARGKSARSKRPNDREGTNRRRGGAGGRKARPRTDSDSQKGLPRGPQALPRERVAAHQRERLVEAMVQAVSERGVVATTISDLVARAGISRRTFYEHFDNKEDCLLATYDTVVETEAQRLLALAGGGEGWLEQLEAIIRALFDAIAVRPDAARLICVEMGASGEIGVQRWADGATRFERFISAGFERAPGPGTIPDPVARAVVGSLRKIAYTRVREERSNKSLKAEFARIVPELMEWIAGYYPSPPSMPLKPRRYQPRWLEGGRAPGTLSPPAPWGVRGLPRGEHNLPRGFVEFNQRERIFDAIAKLTARDGYQALSLEDIAAAAAVSLQTFYSHFENKEEAFLATFEVGHTRAKAAVNRALAHQTDWVGGVRAGARALLEFLASEPALAHLSCVDILIAYPHVAGRVAEANGAYAELLDMDLGEGAPSQSSTPIVGEAIVGGVFELLHDYILRGQTRRLPELTDHVSYIALTPFIGREAAAEAITQG
ncbi:MAG TPA: TetR/AcrR family transcriptional regulator [Solirubrobacteraceae bacterium]|nr:TetR/AcrR family transcriptional regulator [Solirubrobacteraceae bacterium]